MSRAVRIVLAVVIALGLSVAWMHQDGAAQSKQRDNEVTTAEPSESEFSLASDYWNAERTAEAEAIPWYDAEADGQSEQFDAPAELGPPGAVAGGLGTRAAQPRRLLAIRGDFLSDVDFGTANIDDSNEVNKTPILWQQYPYRTVGKLLLTTPSGGSGYCTASNVSGNSKIVTAAHCCYTRGQGWNRNFNFIPANRGTCTTSACRPYGTFPWTSASVLTAWITSGGRQNDVCVLSVGRNSAGQALAPRVGWLGRSWNGSQVVHDYAFGYPSNIDGGLYKYEAAAETYRNCGSTLVNAQGSPMTFGSSGGPWVRTFKRFIAGANNYVHTVVSGHDSCTGTFGQSFNGPRFTSNNIVPLCTAQGC
jgi:V8-like Glu-specific endopeptidase